MPIALPADRRAQIVERARAWIGSAVSYGLGAGSSDPRSDSPADETGRCDCSAFVCWVLGLKKFSPYAWLREVNGGWYNTNGIYWDARFETTGVFEWVRPGEVQGGVSDLELWPGDVIVYPGSSTRFPVAIGKTPKIGHVGIISEVNRDEIEAVIHCSAGNQRNHGHAIAETSAKVFRVQPTTIISRCTVLP